MKTLKTIIPVAALLITLGVTTVFAKNQHDDDRLTKDYAISTYVDAVTNGKVEGLEAVIDKNTKFCVMQGKTMVSYSKAQVMAHLTNIKNIKQACTTTTTLVEDNSEVAVLRVDMQYENFTRTNYVTIAHTGDGWKITNVCSVFK